MIVHMHPEVKSPDDPRVQAIVQKVQRHGLIPDVHSEQGTNTAAIEIYLKDNKHKASTLPTYIFENMPGVSHVVRVSAAKVSPVMNGDRERHTISVGDRLIGPNQPCLLVAGQCSDDLYTPKTIEVLVKQGILDIRTGFRKPRSSPMAFRGFGIEGLKRTFVAARQNGVRSVWMEVIESPDIDEVRRARDETGFAGKIVLWVGARNGNYRLLEALGKQNEFAVMLKNGLYMKTIDDLMNVAGWVLTGPMWWKADGTLDEEKSTKPGNDQLIFCLRGLLKSDAHDPHRFQPNFNWIDHCHDRCWVNTCLDCSHTGGEVELVIKDLAEGITHNPDIVMIESHINPEEALTDKDQAIPAREIGRVIEIVEKHNQRLLVNI